jgi:putative ATP-binding cassette transporter
MSSILRLLSFLLRLSPGIRFSRPTVLFVAVAGIVSGAASTGMIALVSSIAGAGGSTTGTRAGLFIGLCLTLPIFRFLSQVLLIGLSQKSLLSLRLKLARRILGAPLRSLEELGAARLLATLTRDIEMIVNSLSTIPLLFMHMAIVLFSLAYLGWLSTTLLLQTLGFIILGVLSYQATLRHAFKFFRKSRERMDDVMKHIRSLIEGVKELKMHRPRQEEFIGSFEASTIALQKDDRSGQVVFIAGSVWGQTIFYFVLGLLVFVVPRYQVVDKVTLIGYILVLMQLMSSLEIILNLMPAMTQAAIASEKIDNLGLSLLQPEMSEGGSQSLSAPTWGRLELVGVTHTYHRENNDNQFLLGPIDLTLRPGELVFLVGGNGSGKTTLAKLIVGLYSPESGEIRSGGSPVTDASREHYRQLFSVVFSDFFVFWQLFGISAEALDAKAVEYLEKLKLDTKVRIEAGRLSTVDVSQGQRKRLALLTAYLEDREIYLFDEWAADQDPSFKKIFYLEMLPQLKARGKTVIAISHDDHYFHVADRIIKLDSGRIDLDLSGSELASAGYGQLGAAASR